jgi:perosamine synthetase
MNIPIFKLEFDRQFINKFKKSAEEILVSNRPLSEDKYVKLFENKFAKLVGAKYSVAVSNGTAAIELSLKALDVRGKTVLIPCNTFFATTVAVTNAGAKIELVDIEEENFSISPVDLERVIKKYFTSKEKIGAVIIVHIGGIISNHILEIKRICNKYKIPLVEDAAHAHCSKYGNLRAGTIGVVGCFSFFPTKVMTSGEGGMITTNDRNIYKYILSIKNFGRDNNDANKIINPGGNNFKVTELTGLLGSMECDRVLERIKKRNKLVNIYISRLKDSGYIPVLQKKGLCSQYKMILKTSIDRDWLKKFCKEHGIALTGEVYRIPIHQQPLYLKQFKGLKFPVTEKIAKSHICPPLYPELTSKEIKYVCDVLLKAENEYEK